MPKNVRNTVMFSPVMMFVSYNTGKQENSYFSQDPLCSNISPHVSLKTFKMLTHGHPASVCALLNEPPRL